MDPVWDEPAVRAGMHHLLGRREEALSAGRRSVGWKVGFSTQVLLDRLGLSAPLVGFLTESGGVPSGGTFSTHGFGRPHLEPEIAVYLASDLPGGATMAQARAAIAGIGPAIELVDTSELGDDVEALLAGNLLHRGFVLGSASPMQPHAETTDLTVHVTRDGEEVSYAAEPTALTGDLVSVVKHVADTLAAFGHTLAAGEIVLTGSTVAPLSADGEGTIEFELRPVGRVSTRLTALPAADDLRSMSGTGP